MTKNSKVLVCGGRGLVGSAIVRKLIEKGYKNIIATYHSKMPNINNVEWVKIDLKDKQNVDKLFDKEKPEYIFLAAAKVGGIMANNVYRADFIYENLEIQNSIIYNAYKHKVKKLMFLGSTCIYPKNCPQPIKEEYLLTGELEYTNEPYAIAKIAGIKMCESFNIQYGTNFISVMPTNLYGENDNFDLETSHVLPALLRKIYLGKCLENEDFEAIRNDLNKRPIEGVDGSASKEEILKILDKYGVKVSSEQYVVSSKKENTTHYPLPTTNSVKIEIWGSGKPMREFLYSDDMADACVYLMEKVDFNDIINYTLSDNNSCDVVIHNTKEIRNTHINIGTGKDISIKDLAYLTKDIIGYRGEFYFNTSKPDGTMRKVTNVSKLHRLGWKHKVKIEEGIKKVYEWYLN